ncbi:MAG: hypothetical protein IJX12_07375 [Lachnospiraceae bacterium]|nr:hypothetical protein [Lachnospiraceae bacterium]
MKLKYFLRGLGAGIIFGALIMLAAYMTSGAYKMSDEEIIERAEALGMVKSESSILSSSEDDKENLEDSKSSEEAVKDDTKDTEELTSEDTEEPTTEEPTTEATTEATTTEATTEEAPSATNKTIKVVSGMSSYEVSVILKDAGIITDAGDFDSYLNSHGYSTRIEVGEFECNADMTYEELAKILTNTVE